MISEILFWIDVGIRKTFLFTLPSFFICSSWLFCALELSLIISSQITAIFSLIYPPLQIDTLKELVDSNISLVVASSFPELQNIKDKNIFHKIMEKSKMDKTILPIKNIFDESKWIVDTSYGGTAIFFYEVPLKQLILMYKDNLKSESKFRFIGEKYGNTCFATIASSLSLSKEFRDLLNFK